MNPTAATPSDDVATSPPDFRLGDCPWFWLALFGVVAMIGIVVVNHKYSRRQMRLEMRYENRIDVQARRQATASGEALPPDRIAAPIDAQTPHPRAGLWPLLVTFGMATIVGYVGLLLSYAQHRRQRRSSTAAQSGAHACTGSSKTSPG